MPEIKSVTVQIYAPKENDPGQITVGYYTITDGTLTMVHADGQIVKDDNGATFEVKLTPEHRPQEVAAALTRKVRRALRKETETLERFRRPIDYSRAGMA